MKTVVISILSILLSHVISANYTIKYDNIIPKDTIKKVKKDITIEKKKNTDKNKTKQNLPKVKDNKINKEEAKNNNDKKDSVKYQAIPAQMYNTLINDCNNIEVTMYTSSKTFSFPNNKACNYILSLIDLKRNFNEKTIPANKSGFMMFIVKDDFYMDAYLVINGEKNSYLVFVKDNKEYYNYLSIDGYKFFKQYS